VGKWLRQQSKDLYAVGFDAPGKQWDKCINVDGGCQEINVFSRFYILYSFVTKQVGLEVVLYTCIWEIFNSNLS
jgi:hypothetical protein